MSDITITTCSAEDQLQQASQTCMMLMVLLNLINPGTLLKIASSKNDGATQGVSYLWHRFLDKFAWLGDLQRGGTSVTAVAGVLKSGRPTLLVSCNNSVRDKAYEHLNYVLKTLQQINVKDTELQRQTQDEIWKQSVVASRGKIINYHYRLCKLIERVNPLLKNSDSEHDRELLEILTNIAALTKNHFSLCEAADLFLSDDRNKHLKQMGKVGINKSLFGGIQHYLERLTSWRRASKRLVTIAVCSPELLKDLVLEKVPAQLLACGAPEASEDELRKLIERLQLGLRVDNVLQKLQELYEISKTRKHQHLTDTGEAPDIQRAFYEWLTKPEFRPAIHTESLMADHIHVTSLKYLRDDRYIGCSKPSCVACHFYLMYHPGDILPRPCHGNVWPKWCPTSSASPYASEVVASVTRDLTGFTMDRLMNGRITRTRLPDSQTGITPSSRNVALAIRNRV